MQITAATDSAPYFSHSQTLPASAAAVSSPNPDSPLPLSATRGISTIIGRGNHQRQLK